MTYVAAETRYDRMQYRRSGRSGLKLPAISLGLWQNFGGETALETSRAIVRRAFDLGVTHFDLANNYGPPYGSAEETFGRLMASDLRPYRDELIVSAIIVASFIDCPIARLPRAAPGPAGARPSCQPPAAPSCQAPRPRPWGNAATGR